MHDLAWPYLNELAQMRQLQGSTRRVRLERVEVEFERLERSLGGEARWLPGRTEARPATSPWTFFITLPAAEDAGAPEQSAA